MKKIQVSSSGFPMTNDTLRQITDADKELMQALCGALGELVIITGVELVDGVYSNGYVAINGEILPFIGGELQSTVTVNEQSIYGEYDADNNHDSNLDVLPVYVNRTASFGSGGVTSHNFSDFTRLLTVKQLTDFTQLDFVLDPDYVHTDLNFTEELSDRLNAIVSNVQANWNAVAGLGKILNKPTNLAQVLHNSNIYVGDFSGTINIPVTFGLDIGTSTYQVYLSFESTSPNDDTSSFFHTIYNKTGTGFKLSLREAGNYTQNLKVYYMVLPYPIQ